jgi:hypothetical protein
MSRIEAPGRSCFGRSCRAPSKSPCNLAQPGRNDRMHGYRGDTIVATGISSKSWEAHQAEDARCARAADRQTAINVRETQPIRMLNRVWISLQHGMSRVRGRDHHRQCAPQSDQVILVGDLQPRFVLDGMVRPAYLSNRGVPSVPCQSTLRRPGRIGALGPSTGGGVS